MQVKRDWSPHRVLHLVHDLALELRRRPLPGRAFARRLDPSFDDELAELAVTPPKDPELLGDIPRPAGPHRDPFA